MEIILKLLSNIPYNDSIQFNIQLKMYSCTQASLLLVTVIIS